MDTEDGERRQVGDQGADQVDWSVALSGRERVWDGGYALKAGPAGFAWSGCGLSETEQPRTKPKTWA